VSVETSTECGDLFAALSKAQAAVTAAAKDKTNPHFRNSYADLASVWDACRGPLTDNDLSITQWPETVENGVAVTTVLGHASGQWMRSVLVMPLDAKATAQQVGSAVTYARRYMLAAVAGVAPDDDDGNAASEAPPKNKPAPKQSKPAPKPEAKARPTATRGIENSECRKAWAKYAVTASNRGEKPRELASFLAEVTGKPEAEVVANEPKWNAIGESYWAKAAVAIAYAVSELPPPKPSKAGREDAPEREPGEDDAGADEYFEDQEAGAA
jgi:hypothetical protein